VLALSGCGAAAAATLAIELTASTVIHSFTPGFTAYFPRDGADPLAVYFPPVSEDTVVFAMPAERAASLNGISRVDVLLLAPAGSIFSLSSSSFPLGIGCTIQTTVSSRFVLPGEASVRLLGASASDLTLLAEASPGSRNRLLWTIHARSLEPLPDRLIFSGMQITVEMPTDYGDETLALDTVNFSVWADRIGDTEDPCQFLRLVPEPSVTVYSLVAALAMAFRRTRHSTSG
jgi:hypothetical protein